MPHPKWASHPNNIMAPAHCSFADPYGEINDMKRKHRENSSVAKTRHGVPILAFREFDSFFVSWNRIPSCFLFRGRVQSRIPGVASILFSRMEFRVVFNSVERFRTLFREFSVPCNSRNSVRKTHLFRLFRLPQNYFCRKFPTLLQGWPAQRWHWYLRRM